MDAEQIRALRKKLGLKQVEFGKVLGFANPNVTISNMETGKTPITPQTERLCLYIQKYGVLPEIAKEL